MLRTHNCGELRTEDIAKEVILCGWVHRRRDHGKIVFIDLRDRYGLTQIVFLPHNKQAYKEVQGLSNEYVLRIKGIVNERPSGTQNPKIPTGMVEVEAKEVEVLNKSRPLPFEIGSNVELSEEFRLKYRFLDLRDSQSLYPLILRHRINKLVHNFFDAQGFLEIETPFLTKSTPEGARDFLVPSRLNPGRFYALPQSPQLFKQMLMVAGVDRYYQIVRCFRDEDLRKDRQPEFTQLDLEMSFVEEEDIFRVMEEFLRFLFKEVEGIDLIIPFPRLSWKEAQSQFGSDKPDLRDKGSQKYSFLWVVDFPLFSYNEDEKRYEAEHHPFTSPKEEDIPFLDTDPGRVRARSYDLVLNGVEIGSGSIRIHNIELQRKIFEMINIPEDIYRERFGFFLEALKYGAPPHGGFALGLDRLCSIIAKRSTIRDVIGFPKTQRGVCPLTGAPQPVEERQLRELNIEIRE